MRIKVADEGGMFLNFPEYSENFILWYIGEAYLSETWSETTIMRSISLETKLQNVLLVGKPVTLCQHTTKND